MTKLSETDLFESGECFSIGREAACRLGAENRIPPPPLVKVVSYVSEDAQTIGVIPSFCIKNRGRM